MAERREGLGVALAIGMFLLSNIIIPRFFREASDLIERDALTVLTAQLNRNLPFKQGEWVIYADEARELPLTEEMRQQYSQSNVTPRRLIELRGVAVANLASDGKVGSDATALRQYAVQAGAAGAPRPARDRLRAVAGARLAGALEAAAQGVNQQLLGHGPDEGRVVAQQLRHACPTSRILLLGMNASAPFATFPPAYRIEHAARLPATPVGAVIISATDVMDGRYTRSNRFAALTAEVLRRGVPLSVVSFSYDRITPSGPRRSLDLAAAFPPSVCLRPRSAPSCAVVREATRSHEEAGATACAGRPTRAHVRSGGGASQATGGSGGAAAHRGRQLHGTHAAVAVTRAVEAQVASIAHQQQILLLAVRQGGDRQLAMVKKGR